MIPNQSYTNELMDNTTHGVADIVFLIDSTGSMAPCIKAVKESIDHFVEMLTHADANGGSILSDWRISICGYRDYRHDPKLGTPPLEMFPFVRSVSEAQANLKSLVAKGGGDEPESLLDALYEVIDRGATEPGEAPMPERWRARNEAARCVIVFTDASFHPTMEVMEGGTADDLALLMKQEKIRLTLYAPEDSPSRKKQRNGYLHLQSFDRVVYEKIRGEDPVRALREFVQNRENFYKVMEAIAKSVTKSAEADVPTPL